ncbi:MULTISPECIES: hypothetical protein [Streptomyces]|uniref:hypothetical protein n=1 Tax=Streptomyces TaxID=1883 RepID=UPI00167BF279|nr:MULTISPECIES: hypothetical protein [Streptomyces]MBK3521100.1 hypothetical protein [Streptomyces sp. MBT70]GGR59930.1 hypothetical protein GCM10010236_10860 [Streptomyces eurythermus]
MTTRRTAQWLALGLCAAGLAAVQPAQAAQAAGKEQVLVFDRPAASDATFTVQPSVKKIIIEAWGGGAAGQTGAGGAGGGGGGYNSDAIGKDATGGNGGPGGYGGAGGAGAGGGAGGYTRCVVTWNDFTSDIKVRVHVGAGGTSGAPGRGGSGGLGGARGTNGFIGIGSTSGWTGTNGADGGAPGLNRANGDGSSVYIRYGVGTDNPGSGVPKTVPLAAAQSGEAGAPAQPGTHGAGGSGGKHGTVDPNRNGADGAWGESGANGTGGQPHPSIAFSLKAACPDSGQGDAVNSPGQQGRAGGNGQSSHGLEYPTVGGQPNRTAAQPAVALPVPGVGRGGVGGNGAFGGSGGYGARAERSTSSDGHGGFAGSDGTSGTKGGNGYVRVTLVS